MSLIQRYDSLKTAAELSVKEVQNFDALVQGILTKVVLEVLHKYQQKINVGIQDSVSDLLDTFKHKITQAIFDTANTWKVANREPILFPRGCRFCSTKGQSTIFVIEEDPQIRSLSFVTDMMASTFRPTVGSEHVSLALPYVVFVVHFRSNDFAGLYCGWRTRALTGLDNLLVRPLLPNIHDNLNVCMGHSLELRGNMVEQSSSAITHFWHSTFNNDLSDGWWGKFRIDNKLMTGRRWMDETIRDASFILQLDLGESRSLQYQLDLLTMHEQEPDENAFRHRLAENIDRCVADLFAGTMRYFKKTKFDRYEPQDISDILRQVLQRATAELVDVVFALDVEIKRLAEDVARQHKVPVIGVGDYWRKYEEDPK